MELSADGEARVLDAIARARADVEGLRYLRRPEVMKAVERLASAWEAMPPFAKTWIHYRLMEDAAGPPPEGDANAVEDAGRPPVAVDVGGAARAMLAHFGGKQGERLDSWPIKAAVQALFVEFVEAGGAPEVGNRAHRQGEGREDHPACTFVAEHLLRLFKETFGRDRTSAERRADTYLRELNRDDRIPTRKKPLDPTREKQPE